MLIFPATFPLRAVAQIAPTNTVAISGSVVDVTGKPVADAAVSLAGPRSMTVHTDKDGLFVFAGIPPGTYRISVAAAALGTMSQSIVADNDINVAIQYQPKLKTISSVRTTNAGFNVTPASTTHVNPMALALEGQTLWRKTLEQIPGIGQIGPLSGNRLNASMSDSPLQPMQISLDGTFAYENAMLLDDMPLISGVLFGYSPAGGGTNLGAYPLNGFSGADVIRGPGANSPSIVDSIGGSFVLHSPGVVDQNRFDFSVATDAYGGLIENGIAAVRMGKLSATVSYGANNSPGPLHGATFSPIIGTSSSLPITVGGQYFACINGCPYHLLTVPGYTGFAYYGYGQGILFCCQQNSSAWTEHSGSIGLTYHVSPAIDASFFYAGQNVDQIQSGFNETFAFAPPAGYSGSVSPGNYLVPSEATYEPDQQSSSLVEEKISARIGKGILRAAALQNRIFLEFNDAGNPLSGMQRVYGGGGLCATNSPPCGSAGNPATPTVFNGQLLPVTFGPLSEYFHDQSANRDMLLSYTMPVGETSYAGVSYVKSYYDTPSQYHYNFPAFGLVSSPQQPPDTSESTGEGRIFYGGDLTRNSTFDLSMYFANADYHIPNPVGYNSITGESSNGWLDSKYTYSAPRLGLVWRPTPSVALRLAAGGGFAEGPLYYLVGANGTCLPSAPSCTITQQNINLQPEKAFAFDIGSDLRLKGDTLLSFDVYRANLHGQIFNSTSFAGIGTCPGNATAPCYITQYQNLGLSRFEGVTLAMHHDVPLGVYWDATFGLTRGYVVNVPAGFYNNGAATCNFTTGAGCKNQYIVPGINYVANSSSGLYGLGEVPYAQGSVTLGYRAAPDKYVALIANYYGHNNSYLWPAFMEFDGRFSYPVSHNSSLLFSFTNLTGIYSGAIQTWVPDVLHGTPAEAGPPYVVWAEPYGPRTTLLTYQIHLR